MAKAGYVVTTQGQVAAAAAGTAKTILAVYAPATFGIDLKAWSIDFDGVTASEKPVLVELVRFTGLDGTGTAVSVLQAYGRAITAGFTANKNYTAEPATPEVLWANAIDPNKGFIWPTDPLGETFDTDVSDGLGLRITVPTGGAAVNARATMKFERT